jgi:4a-hydroxytetrahydrobiopterin dehydratase
MKLTDHDISLRLLTMPGWHYEGDALTRKFELPSFLDVIAFVTRLAFVAEAADHHPDLTINYKRVTVTWTTHSEDGVTEKDFAGAAQSDKIAGAFGA